MPHAIETASSGRSKCRGCGKPIAKGTLRLGERLPNVFADGEMTLWFHVPCAAYRRPEALSEVLEGGPPQLEGGDADGDVDADAGGDGGGTVDWAQLGAIAAVGVQHPRLQRIAATERSKTGRASCRHCREAIAKDTLRVVLQYFEDARFVPSGFVHPGCALEFVGTPLVKDAIARAPTTLDEPQLQQLLSEVAPPS